MKSARILFALLALSVATSSGRAVADDPTTSTVSGVAGVVGRYRGFADDGGFLNILPPGQNSGVTGTMLKQIAAALKDEGDFPPHYVDQLQMYQSLVQATALTDATLTDYFKDSSFGVAEDDIGRVYKPHDDVTVIRDKSFGVPHIYGVTRYATMFGEGYSTAEDRMFFMDVLRHVGRGRLAEMIGYDEGFIGRDQGTVATSPYTEKDLTAQVNGLEESGAEGASIVADIRAYADGVNEYLKAVASDDALMPVEYTLLNHTPEPWIAEDAVAIATLVGGIFGRGGGREVRNACGLERLSKNLGDDPRTARQIFDDLHFLDDPKSPTTSSTSTPYALGESRKAIPAANPKIDCTSLVPISEAAPAVDDLAIGLGKTSSLLARDNRWAPTFNFLRTLADAQENGVHMSNAILIGGHETKSGRPIAVFGPQIGYSAPELLTEKDVHGPGIDARGVGFLGVDFYVLLGRGDSYAWSATSSGSDNVDQGILKLCNTAGGEPTLESDGYLQRDACKAFETWEHTINAPATALAPTPKNTSWAVQRSEHGPVLWRGTLADGTPIAIVEKRSTYGHEADSAFGFKQLNDPEFMAAGVDSFRLAVGNGIDYTFNWFYADNRDIAMQNSCLCPIRAEKIDATTPVLFGGPFDWSGEFLRPSQLPHAVNPDSGFLISWNNRPAPGWEASDAEFSYGPVHRSLLLSRKVRALLDADRPAEPSVVRSDIVAIMRDAATQDLRGVEVLPLLLGHMGDPPASAGARLLDMRERLEIWADSGAFRRDADDDGEYDDPVAPAIMDAWWKQVLIEIFKSDGDALLALQIGNDGLDSYSETTSAVVAAITDSTQHSFCVESGCSKELWRALRTAKSELEVEFGTSDVSLWQRTIEDDQISYATLLAGMPSMQWQNRPTFQQVVQLETDRERPTPSRDPFEVEATPPLRNGSSSKFGRDTALPALVGVGLLALIVTLGYKRQVRRRRSSHLS